MSEPQTAAGKELLAREAHNMRSFALITPEAIATIEAEARNATLDEVVRAVEALPPAWATDEHYRVVHGVTRDAVLDAVKALRS